MITALILLALHCQAIQGLYDSECPGNYYGSDCSISCGKCGGNGTCYKSNGICKTGCLSGYAGLLCQDKCPGTCGGDGSCSPTTLFCRDGCKAGYTGLLCGSDDSNTTSVKECSNCLQPCGPNGCTYGCVTGFYGLYCSLKCVCPVGVPCQQNSGRCFTQRGNSTPTAAPDVIVTTLSTSVVIVWLPLAVTISIISLAFGVFLIGCWLYKRQKHQGYPTYEDPIMTTGGLPYNRPQEPEPNSHSYLEIDGTASSLYVDELDSPHYATIEESRLHISTISANPYLNDSESI
ncbi:scavenger receptor class F member 2-like [Crassostrea angulata]|uniref:scavenger receptor class F member 2-like n=1 Tax=Magallana angulata TaxID=2784310 RepID=UPI0022B1AC5E|nr:scavenger receptor class F member 2-like [Crassostrea angulata]